MRIGELTTKAEEWTDMSEKWTNGPWRTNGASCVLSRDGGDVPVCCCTNGSTERDNPIEDNATASLISAAHDMYEALADLVDAYEEHPGFGPARYALAKARGEQDEESAARNSNGIMQDMEGEE